MRVYSQAWHNDECQRSQEHISKQGVKRFFCLTHNQWAAELPVKQETTYVYGDDSSYTKVVHYDKD